MIPFKPKVVALKGLQWLVYIISKLLSATLGYSIRSGWKKEQLRAATNYESSAQLLKVGFRAKFIDMRPASLDQFLLFHIKYVNPSTVCQDHITLLTVTSELALFAVLPEEVDTYSSDVSPFMYMAQFKFATHLILMPISSFHRLADELGDPTAQVLLLSNTGRCGSTLLAQMFESVPNTIVMSEPDAFTQTSQDFSCGKISGEEEDNLLRSIVRVQCKANKGGEVKRYIIKTSSMGVRQIYKIFSSCKYVRHLYMYRHPKETILSYWKSFGNVSPSMIVKLLHVPDIGGDYDIHSKTFDRLLQSLKWPGLFAFVWVMNIACYIEYKHRGVDIYPITYEDLMKDTKTTTSKLFSFLGIPGEFIAQSMNALQKDSHRGTFLARKQLAKNKIPELTKDQVKEINFVLQNSGFSSLEDFEDLPDKHQLKLDSFFAADILG